MITIIITVKLLQIYNTKLFQTFINIYMTKISYKVFSWLSVPDY